MKKSLLFIVLAAFILSGCSSLNYYVKVHHDKFDDYSKFELLDNQIQLTTGQVVELNVRNVIRDSTSTLAFEIGYYASEWIFIEKGNSLTILADTNKIRLSGAGSRGDREVTSAGRIQERAYYSVTKQEYEQIMNASKVELKLSGDKYFIEGNLNKKNKANLQKFYRNYINNAKLCENPEKFKGSGMANKDIGSAVGSLVLIITLIYVLTLK
jgi:hypothetical protein